MASHMLILPLVDLYATACDWRVGGRAPAPPDGLAWFLVVSYLNGMVIEIGRKTRAPADEEHGVETYSALWGVRGAVARLAPRGAADGRSRRGRRRSRIGTEVPTLADAGGCSSATCAIVGARVHARRAAPPRQRQAGSKLMAGVWTVLHVSRARRRAAGLRAVAEASDDAADPRCRPARCDSPHVGGKARALAGQRAADWPCRVVVLSRPRLRDSLTPAQHAAARRRVVDAHVIADVPMACGSRDRRRALRAALLRTAARLAVRSSASDEDGDAALVCRAARELPERCARRRTRSRARRVALGVQRRTSLPIAASTDSARPASSGGDPAAHGRAAGVWRGVQRRSGVRPPWHRRRRAPCAGMGDALVAGDMADADTWRVDREGEIVRAAADGVGTAQGESPVLSDDQVRAVAALARQAARLSAAPGHRVGDRRSASTCCSRARSRRCATTADPDGAPAPSGTTATSSRATAASRRR